MNQRIIEAIFTGDSPAEYEVAQLAKEIATVGFDPSGRVVAGSRLNGNHWRGSRLAKQSLISVADAHYLRHVVHRQEWPEGTDLAGYERSIAGVISDPSTGVFAILFRGLRQIGFARRSLTLRGPEGGE